MYVLKKHLPIVVISFIFLATSTPNLLLKNKVLIQFNSDAGLVSPLNNNSNIIASSNQSEIYKIQDNDNSTAWQSDAPLPTGFINNESQNILLNYFLNNLGFKKVTDGNLNNSERILKKGEFAAFEILIKNNHLYSISLKVQAISEIKLIAELTNGNKSEIGTIREGDNFQLKRFCVNKNNVKSVKLISNENFDLFEIAALAEAPKEYVIFQFSKPQKIGTIKGKLWAGQGTAIMSKIYGSQDGVHWNYLTNFSPEANNELLIAFSEQLISFLKIEHTLIPEDWNKVYFWEIKLYNKNAHYGEKPMANQSAVNLKEMLGVNGYWSWGTDKYSHLLGKNEGPRKFKNLISHARNYHDLTWDINHPNEPIDFSKMKENGTPAKNWVNWDLEYEDWKNTGFDIQASFQFYRFNSNEWKTPEKSAYNYAFSFADHFGNENGNGLVCTIEVGNEPWDYPADIYQKILKGMVEGARAADKTIEIFPCALQAADASAEYNGMYKNYIGARVNEEMAKKLDGVNAHVYSYITEPNGKRKAVHPEHPQSTFWEINNMIEWRNQNMPGKKIYLSEWGWDHGGGGENCTHDVCVSEHAAAIYAVRGLLIASRLGVERATWYFHNNAKGPSSLYMRSGLVSSGNTGFQRKGTFYALQSLVDILGDSYFLKIIKEDESAWIYLFGDKLGNPSHIIGWLPIDGDSDHQAEIYLNADFDIIEAYKLNGLNHTRLKSDLPVKVNNRYMLKLSSQPTVYQLNK